MKKYPILLIFLLQAFIFNLTNVITPSYLSLVGAPKSYYGYFFGLWSLGMLFSSPLWGALGDLYGKKKFVVIGLLIYAVAQASFYFIDNLYILSLTRLISGIGVGAPVTLLLSYMIGTVQRFETATYLSLRMGFLTLGQTISYKVSGYLGLTQTKELFLYQSLLTFLLIIGVLLFIRKDKERVCTLPRKENLFTSIKHIPAMDKRQLLFLLSVTFATMTFINIDKFIDLYIIDSGYDSLALGDTKMIFGITTILVNLLLIPKLKKYLGNVYILQVIQIVMAIITLLVFSGNNLLFLIQTLFLVYVVLRAIFTTSEQLYISKNIPTEDLGIHMGVRQSFTCLGMVLGPIIGSHIYSTNPQNLFIFSVICLLVSSSLLAHVNHENISKRNREYAQ